MAFLERNANRGSISTTYDVDNSLKVEGDNNEYLSRSTSGASDGNSTQHTISVWVKRTGTNDGSTYLGCLGGILIKEKLVVLIALYLS